MTPLIVVGILVMEPFLSWWIAPAFAQQSAPVGQLILVGFWANGFALIPYAQLQARGRPDLVAKCHLGEVLPYFALLYLGLSAFGMIGAAAAFSLRVLGISHFSRVLLASCVYRSATLRTPALMLGAAFFIATQSGSSQPVWLVFGAANVLIALILGCDKRQPPFGTLLCPVSNR